MGASRAHPLQRLLASLVTTSLAPPESSPKPWSADQKARPTAWTSGRNSSEASQETCDKLVGSHWTALGSQLRRRPNGDPAKPDVPDGIRHLQPHHGSAPERPPC